jgi:hypothetical protein
VRVPAGTVGLAAEALGAVAGVVLAGSLPPHATIASERTDEQTEKTDGWARRHEGVERMAELPSTSRRGSVTVAPMSQVRALSAGLGLAALSIMIGSQAGGNLGDWKCLVDTRELGHRRSLNADVVASAA